MSHNGYYTRTGRFESAKRLREDTLEVRFPSNQVVFHREEFEVDEGLLAQSSMSSHTCCERQHKPNHRICVISTVTTSESGGFLSELSLTETATSTEESTTKFVCICVFFL
jgi:hypothetical protein